MPIIPKALNPLASPKQRFISNPANITNHRALVDSEAFQRAVDTALLDYMAENASKTTDQVSAMSGGFKITGAQEFVARLKTLSEVQMMPAIVRPNDHLPETDAQRRQ